MSQKNQTKPISDKALNRLVIGSVISILTCLIALCSTTFCWFTDSVTTKQPNIIQAASACLLEIEVVNNGTGVPLADIENGVTLVKDERYKVTLTLPKDSASGYCEMLVGSDKYRSDFIVRHDEDTAKTLTYYVTARADTEVKFVVHWGIYSATPDVLADDTLEIG